MEMDAEKTPGPNGFSMAFFKNSWEVVKHDLMKVFEEFFVRGTINKSMNSTFINVIPKKDDPQVSTKSLQKFCPKELGRSWGILYTLPKELL